MTKSITLGWDWTSSQTVCRPHFRVLGPLVSILPVKSREAKGEDGFKQKHRRCSLQFHLVRAPWTSRIWTLERPVDFRSLSAVNRDPGTRLHDWALRSFPPISRCRNFIKSLLHLCSLYCTIQVLRAERFFFFFFPCKREGRKVLYAVKVKKSEEPHLRVLLFSSRAPISSFSGRSNAVTMGPAIFKNILKLPAKGENGTFALVFLCLMALPAMPRPPWAIN